jgi:GT2 family glycosyltransferase
MKDYELIIVDDHSSDGSDVIARMRCDTFIRLEKNSGPSAARNEGAKSANSDLLFLLDADVLVEPDTLERVLAVFEKNPGVSASFCSYQHDTIPQNFISQYKNLQHHYTHQISGREAATFCGGFGAIRTDVFNEMDGFDVEQLAMEDVELGYRLHKEGHRILLTPEIQLTHCKQYSLSKLVVSDVFYRAIPWTKIMLQRRIFRSDLNMHSNNMLSLFVVLLMILTPIFPLPLLATEVALLTLFVVLNREFLNFLFRSRGWFFALRALPLIWFQYFYSGVGLGLGMLAFLKDTLFPVKSKPGATTS